MQHAGERDLVSVRRCLSAAAVGALLTQPVLAQVARPDGQWYGSLGAGATLATGETRNTAVNVAADARRATQENRVNLYGNYVSARSRTAGVTTISSDQARIGGRYDWNLTTDYFTYGLAELNTNRVDDIRLRQTYGGGAGVRWFQRPDLSLDLFTGLAHTSTEYRRAVDDTNLELILGEELVWNLSSTSSLQQRFVIYPSLENTGEYRATLDASLVTAINGAWNMKVSLAARYKSDPPAGLSKTESLFVVGLAYRFGPR